MKNPDMNWGKIKDSADSSLCTSSTLDAKTQIIVLTNGQSSCAHYVERSVYRCICKKKHPQTIIGMLNHRRSNVPQQSTRQSPNYTILALIILLFTSSQRKHQDLFGIALSFPVQAMSMTPKSLPSTPSERTYDVIVIGGGSAGLTAAKLIGPTLQKSCCIIEQSKMGGDCTWTGCIPSKSFIASSKSYYEKHRRGNEEQPQHSMENEPNPNSIRGNYVPPLADLSVVRAEIQGKIQQIYDADDSPEALQKLGNIDVIHGQATIKSSKLVHVATASTTNPENTNSAPQKVIHAKEGIIVCTGAEPKLPTMIPGLDSYYTYETIWDQLSTIPKEFIVIGGGPIGCEIAQAMARFGSNVTIITTSSTILPQEDPDVSKLMSKLFTTKYNINIVHGSVTKVDQISPTAVASTSTTKHVAHVSLLTPTSSGQSSTTVSGDAILVAIGRQPRFIPGFENVGIELNEQRSAIKVNAQLQTSIPNIYAAGDCTGDRQFTHYAGYQGAIAARNILLPFTDPGVLANVPSTIYTSPEVATIGISEKDAIQLYGSSKVVVYQRHLSHVDRAICDGAQDGMIKIICSKKSLQILGATIVTPVAGEMISEIAVMMKAKMSFDKLATVMHPYPSYSMALQLMAAEVYYEKTMKLKWLLDLLKRFGL